jgi:hypothetical protein
VLRLTLRQFRGQGWAAVGLLVLIAVLFAVSGVRLAHIYDHAANSGSACPTVGPCIQNVINVGILDQLLRLVGTALVAVPALIGAFWGAPLISREYEQGTHRLVWAQSVTRTRWLAVKLALVGSAGVAATGLLSLMVTWWSRPIDRANPNQYGAALFGERNITPLGYAAFAIALGVTIGFLIRRTLPAMATTVGVFFGVRIAFTSVVRQHLLPPEHITQPLRTVVQGFAQKNNGPIKLSTGIDIPNAWVYSTRVVDGSGHPLTGAVVTNSCPDLLRPFSGQATLQACATKLGATYHGIITYQPASRYWPMQWCETGSFLAAALVLAAFCFYRIRRRPG